MKKTVYFHLPGLFEFYELYMLFLPLFYEHKDYFYDNFEIGSIYGAPSDALWGGGRVGFGEDDEGKVFALMSKYKISQRLTFSNSLLTAEHLSDRQCNRLCDMLNRHSDDVKHGIILHSDLLLEHIKKYYPELYLVSSTTKVITDFDEFVNELNREEFKYVVPDFRLNKQLDKLATLTTEQKNKVEFLCNECCYFGCADRKACYENVSQKVLYPDTPDHICKAPDGSLGYSFARAMKNPGFITLSDINNVYLPMGFTNFKIEGRSLGSAMILEFLLYYLTKPEYQIEVREKIYLSSSLDLF